MRFNIKVNLVVSFSLLISHFKVLQKRAVIQTVLVAELISLLMKH